MNIDTSWSKLIRTNMGGYVLKVMESNPSLRYHTPDHVRRIYSHAKTLGITYDTNLDAAILFHDAIYDKFPEKERRSADIMLSLASSMPHWFRDVDTTIVETLIMNTAGHKVTKDVDPTMIMLDLFELTDLESARRNFVDIQEESMLLYGVTYEQAAQGSYDFMIGFKETVINNAKEAPEFWDKVLVGIDETIKLAGEAK